MIHISAFLIWFFGGKHPFLASLQTTFRIIQIKEGKAQPINSSRMRSALRHDRSRASPLMSQWEAERDQFCLHPTSRRVALPVFFCDYPSFEGPTSRISTCGRLSGETGRWIKAQWPLILCGRRAASLSSGCMITPYRSKVVKILRQRQSHTWPSTCICSVYDGVLVQFWNIGDAWVFDTPQFLRIMFRISQQRGLGIDLPSIEPICGAGRA